MSTGEVNPSSKGNPQRLRGFVMFKGERMAASKHPVGSYVRDDDGQEYRRIDSGSGSPAWMPLPQDGNPDPINRPFDSLGALRDQAHASGVRIERVTQADMGPMPEPDGPNYASVDYDDEQKSDDSFWIRLSHSADLIPDRTQSILQNQVPTALRSFIRQNLQYHNTDQALGYQGQFAEIYHITATLKRLMWDSNLTGMATSVANGEIQEQLESLIGHALLALDLLEQGNKNGK